MIHYVEHRLLTIYSPSPVGKRKHTPKTIPDETDEFKPGSDSDTEYVSRKFRRSDRPMKRVKTKDSRKSFEPVKRPVRVIKLAEDKEVVRQTAATANLNTRFLKLPGG
jgi:hypothetical protein